MKHSCRLVIRGHSLDEIAISADIRGRWNIFGRPGVGAFVPDLPGCFAVGKTYEEAEQLIGEAIPFHIRGLIKDGDPIPEPSARVKT